MRDHRPTGDDMGGDRAERDRAEQDITRQMRKAGPGFIPGENLVKRRASNRAANAAARKSRRRNRS